MKEKIAKYIIPISLISLLPSCYNGPQENCVFIGEKANLHKEYYVTVLGTSINEKIEILQYENETNKSELIGTASHFIGVKVKIEHQKLDNLKENHSLDLDDFKVKDHTGIQIGNVNLFSKENGLALEKTNFKTREAVKDYTWFGNEIASGYSSEIMLYFEFPKSLSPENTVMVLEFDFFKGRTNGHAGTDIVLAYRQE